MTGAITLFINFVTYIFSWVTFQGVVGVVTACGCMVLLNYLLRGDRSC